MSRLFHSDLPKLALTLALALVGCHYSLVTPGPSPEPSAGRKEARSESMGDDAKTEPRTIDPEPPKPVEPPFPELSIGAPKWFDLAAATADRETLAPGFAKRGYEPPKNSFVLAGRIERGADQSAFAYLSLGDAGFVNSDRNFWPASAVKLIASLGALATLRAHGLTGDARLEFADHRGRWRRKVERLYCAALTRSSNLAYDRLIRVAGFDEINQGFLTEERGFRHAAFQRAFATSWEGPSLRESPAIAYFEGERNGVIPARRGAYQVERCPSRDNCFSLFELLDALSRVVLHNELPPEARFDLDPLDVHRLKAFLTQSKCGFAKSAKQIFGDQTRIFNKRGYSPAFDMIDHALIVNQRNGRRYLLAASVRYKNRDKPLAKAELARLGAHALWQIAQYRPRGVLLQRDAGAAIQVTVEPVSKAAMLITASADDGAHVDWLELYRGREQVGASFSSCVEAQVPFPVKSDIFVVQAYLEGELVGYRAVEIGRSHGADTRQRWLTGASSSTGRPPRHTTGTLAQISRSKSQ